MGEAVSILNLARQLIRLQGLRTPSDIDIRFTGLRPGEKLHEKLFFPSEQPVGTDHPRVLRVANAASPPLTTLLAAVRQMEHCADHQDGQGALAILTSVVDAQAQHEESESTSNVIQFQTGTE